MRSQKFSRSSNFAVFGGQYESATIKIAKYFPFFSAVGLEIVNATDKQLLSENGGPLTLTKTWTYSKLKRMNMVKRER